MKLGVQRMQGDPANPDTMVLAMATRICLYICIESTFQGLRADSYHFYCC